MTRLLAVPLDVNDILMTPLKGGYHGGKRCINLKLGFSIIFIIFALRISAEIEIVSLL